METHSPILKIQGIDPPAYAALWGDGRTREGMLFYSCGKSLGRDVSIANPEWDADTWREFAAAVESQRAEVESNLGERTGWKQTDVDGLAQLREWALARAKGPQTYTYFSRYGDILMITDAIAAECSGRGDQTENVNSNVGRVEWLANADAIRRTLREYGAWDDDELSDAAENRCRILWIAAFDIGEEPEVYAD